ncbi:MAG: Quaternary ammonium compound-resistance protein SugE [Chlamydiae bacterium]|nr:Quaternary ammonium compound-resistance protein SugE [Chlamydiota bacterium]
MVWVVLTLAGIFEIVWAVGLKYTEGFTKVVPSIITVVAMALSVWFLSIAMKTLPLGISYAIWTGIGIIGTTIIGIFLFGDSASIVKVVCISLILIGILGLRLSTYLSG